jgi:hypothetical protein
MTHSGFGCGFQRPACDSLVFRPSKIRFFTSPGKRSQKFFMRFPQQKPMFQPSLKNIFDFLLTHSTPSPIVTP